MWEATAAVVAFWEANIETIEIESVPRSTTKSEAPAMVTTPSGELSSEGDSADALDATPQMATSIGIAIIVGAMLLFARC